MNIQKIDISTSQRDDSLIEKLDLLLTVKSFDLQAIRKRYIASRNSKSGRAGSVERRKVSLGGIVKLRIENGKVTTEDVLLRLKEPRGIAAREGLLGIAAEDTIYLLEKNIRSLQNPWFSYIHTIDFQDNKMLVASSGFDSLFEYRLDDLSQLWEWFAWENGFSEGSSPETKEPVTLTRHASEAERLKAEGKAVHLVQDPATQSLPTAMRAAFINSVAYDSIEKGKLLATFFHEGAVYQIDQKEMGAKAVLGGLKTPHGGRRLGTQFMATSTGRGEVILQDKDSRTEFLFKNLPGKPSELGEMEWLQNSIAIGDIILTIDSNRTSFVAFDPAKKIYSMVPYNNDWAIQDMILHNISAEQEVLLRSLG